MKGLISALYSSKENSATLNLVPIKIIYFFNYGGLQMHNFCINYNINWNSISIGEETIDVILKTERSMTC